MTAPPASGWAGERGSRLVARSAKIEWPPILPPAPHASEPTASSDEVMKTLQGSGFVK